MKDTLEHAGIWHGMTLYDNKNCTHGDGTPGMEDSVACHMLVRHLVLGDDRDTAGHDGRRG